MTTRASKKRVPPPPRSLPRPPLLPKRNTVVDDVLASQIADIIMNFTVFLATFIIAFTELPKLAAVLLACEFFLFLRSRF